MSTIFAKVTVWHVPSSPAEIRDRGESGSQGSSSAELVPPASVVDKLTLMPQGFALVAIDNGALGYRTAQLSELIAAAAAALGPEGQCVVITGVRSGLRRLRQSLRMSLQLPGLRALRRCMTNAGFTDVRGYFPCPDPRRVAEFYGWDSEYRPHRAGLATTLLRLFGLRRLAFDYALLVGSFEHKTPLLEDIAHQSSSASKHEPRELERITVRPNGVAMAFCHAGHSGHVVRVPLTEAAEQRTRFAAQAAADIAGRHEWLKPYVPPLITSGRDRGLPYFVEGLCRGTQSTVVLQNENLRAAVIESAIGFLERLQSGDDADDADVASADSLAVRFIRPVEKQFPELKKQLDTLHKMTCATMADNSFRYLPVHGDFNPSNVFVNETSGKITGVIDWDACAPDGLPLLDVLHFMLASTAERRRRPLGERVVAALGDEEFSAEEGAILDQHMQSLGIAASMRPVLITYYWLCHIGVHIRYRRHAFPERWVAENVSGPLSAISVMDGL